MFGRYSKMHFAKKSLAQVVEGWQCHARGCLTGQPGDNKGADQSSFSLQSVSHFMVFVLHFLF